MMLFKHVDEGRHAQGGARRCAGWDDEAALDMSGPGPASYEARLQLQKTGWIPWGIRIGGRWWSYQESPLAVVLGGLGGYLDAVRYGELKDRGTLARVYYGVRGMVGNVLRRSMLQGPADLIAAIPKQGKERDEAVARSLARPIGTVLSSRLVMGLDRTMDPTRTDTSTLEGAIMAQIPVVRRLGKPALDVG